MNHSQKGFSHIFIFIFFVVVLVTISFAGWQVYKMRPRAMDQTDTASTPQTNPACQPNATSEHDVAAITRSICELLARDYQVHPKATLSVAGYNSLATDFSISDVDGVWWQFPNDGFSLFHILTDNDSKLDISFGFIAASATDQAARSKLQSVVTNGLANLGLKKQVTPGATGSDNSLFSYENSSSSCQVSPIAGPDSLSWPKGTLTLSCVPISVLTALSSQVKPIYAAVKPFYEKTHLTTTLAFDSAKILASKTDGYKISWGGIVQPEFVSTALYEKNGTWHVVYFSTNRERFSCDTSQYPDAANVRLAFLGQPCDSGSGTVQ